MKNSGITAREVFPSNSNRPVQVTENVALFWRETYPMLKQQLAA
jgi:hypothetical protein